MVPFHTFSTLGADRELGSHNGWVDGHPGMVVDHLQIRLRQALPKRPPAG